MNCLGCQLFVRVNPKTEILSWCFWPILASGDFLVRNQLGRTQNDFDLDSILPQVGSLAGSLELWHVAQFSTDIDQPTT